MKPNAGLVAAASIVREVYGRAHVRVRQWGRLPFRRGPTILVANHQYEDEGEIIVRRTFLQGAWQPLITANSRRMFEPGFFALRLPWTAALTRRYNPAPLFMRLGFMPIENELAARSLLSIAADLERVHGDRLLDEVLRPDTLRALGMQGRRFADLWRPPLFGRAAQTYVKLAHVREPFRSAMIAALRAVGERDIEAIVERVRGGATFFVTPEGRYSSDGRMGRLRGVLDAVQPAGDVWLAAIAYDVFRGRRLSMLYRILPLPPQDDVQRTLMAARPITVSALLAPLLLVRPDGLRAPDAVTAIRATIGALPAAAFVDPELRRDPPRVVRAALRTLVARGTLVRADDRYVLTTRRTHPAFAHVDDMVWFQARMLAETLAALGVKR